MTKLVHNIHYRVTDEDLTTSSTSDGSSDGSRKSTLMDIARSECFLHSQKRIHLADKINMYFTMFKSSIAEGLNYINEILRTDQQPMPLRI